MREVRAMLPTTLNIQGKTFAVLYKDKVMLNDQECCGIEDTFDQYIEISTKYPIECQQSTLLHEIIEVINDLNELGLKHRQISALETGLWQVLKENGLLK
jgi:hypothetical protein